MSQEAFFSGYCRVQDQSRMVAVEYEGSELLDADCCYGSCVYQNECQIGKSIDGLLEHRGG